MREIRSWWERRGSTLSSVFVSSLQLLYVHILFCFHHAPFCLGSGLAGSFTHVPRWPLIVGSRKEGRPRSSRPTQFPQQRRGEPRERRSQILIRASFSSLTRGQRSKNVGRWEKKKKKTWRKETFIYIRTLNIYFFFRQRGSRKKDEFGTKDRLYMGMRCKLWDRKRKHCFRALTWVALFLSLFSILLSKMEMIVLHYILPPSTPSWIEILLYTVSYVFMSIMCSMLYNPIYKRGISFR